MDYRNIIFENNLVSLKNLVQVFVNDKLLVKICYTHKLKENIYLNDFNVYFVFKQPGYSQGLGSLQFASGSSPCVSCMSIYSGHSLPDCSAPALPLTCYYAQMYLHYTDVLRDNDRTKGLRLHMYTEG